MQPARLNQLLEFLKDNPDDDFLNYALAMEYMGINEYEKAKNQLIMLRQRSPDHLATYYQLGKIFEKEGNEQEALLTFESGLALAKKLGDKKTASELQSAIDLL